MLSGTPAAAGDYPLAVTLTDAAGKKERAALALRVRPPVGAVMAVTRRAPGGQVGRAYEVALSAVGGFPPYRWRLAGGSLPPGLALDEPTGRVSGTPSEAGTWTAKLELTDADGRASDTPLELPVEVLTTAGVRRLAITTRGFPTLLHGEPAEVVLGCEGGSGPYRWELTDTPPGLAAAGPALAGTPTAEGEWAVGVSVTDATGQRAEARLPVAVRKVVPFAWVPWLGGLLAGAVLMAGWLAWVCVRRRPAPLRVRTPSVPNARASCEYAVQLACEGGTAPYRWRVVQGELPPGLTLSADGLLSGKPFEGVSVDQTREQVFVVQVTDKAGRTARQRL